MLLPYSFTFNPQTRKPASVSTRVVRGLIVLRARKFNL